MTKSVKEKERLSSIRNYKSKGIPVPSELLKIKIRFWKSRFKEEITGEKEGSKNKIIFDISKNVCRLEFLKMLIAFEVIDINIPEDKFILENLPEIENMIRIANY